MRKASCGVIILGLGILLAVVPGPPSAQATVGWEIGDMVLDFGIDLESGEEKILVDKYEVEQPFFIELTWRLNSKNCLLQVQERTVSP